LIYLINSEQTKRPCPFINSYSNTLAVGGYLIYQKQIRSVVPQPTIQPSPSPVASSTSTNSAETANWKTYTNKKYNFSFTYPAIWILQEGGNFTEYGNDARFYKQGEKVDPSYMAKRGNEQMTIDVTDTQNFDDLKQRSKLKEITVGGKRALELSNGVYILIDSKNILRVFRYPDEEGFMKGILSSFKFQ